jgi:hypothetical protein
VVCPSLPNADRVGVAGSQRSTARTRRRGLDSGLVSSGLVEGGAEAGSRSASHSYCYEDEGPAARTACHVLTWTRPAPAPGASDPVRHAPSPSRRRSPAWQWQWQWVACHLWAVAVCVALQALVKARPAARSSFRFVAIAAPLGPASRRVAPIPKQLWQRKKTATPSSSLLSLCRRRCSPLSPRRLSLLLLQSAAAAAVSSSQLLGLWISRSHSSRSLHYTSRSKERCTLHTVHD